MKNKKGLTLLIIPIILAALVFVLLLTSKDEKRAAPSQKEDKLSYSSKYWGFEVLYPKNYIIEEFPDGVVISNYDTNTKKWTYKPSADEIYIKIEAFEETKVYNRDSSKVIKTINIDGTEQEVSRIDTTSPAKDSYSYLTINHVKNNLKYNFYIEQANSNLLQEAFNIVSSIKFMPRQAYKSSTIPVTTGAKRYENLYWGFAFDYPSDWLFTDFKLWDAKLKSEDKSINVTLLRNGNDKNKKPIDNIVNSLSSMCSADSPDSSIYCPAELMKISEFSSRTGASGYRIERKVISESGYPTSREEYQNTVFVFPLSIQQYYAVVIQPTDILSDTLNSDLTELANTFQYLMGPAS